MRNFLIILLLSSCCSRKVEYLNNYIIDQNIEILELYEKIDYMSRDTIK